MSASKKDKAADDSAVDKNTPEDDTSNDNTGDGSTTDQTTNEDSTPESEAAPEEKKFTASVKKRKSRHSKTEYQVKYQAIQPIFYFG